jgi:mannitol-1-phosphate 5-dehydrogenase
MAIALQFGAGSIGRGFLGQLFSEAGYEVVFVEASARLVRALNLAGEYSLRFVGPDRRERIIVGPVSAIDASDESAVTAAIVRAEIAATSVGVSALPRVAEALARGLTARWETTARPLDLLLGENLPDGPARLRAMVAALRPQWDAGVLAARLGLVETVLSRMVPLQPRDGDLLEVAVEDYARLPVAAAQFLGPIPPLPGLEPEEDLRPIAARKLMVHNLGHAALAYFGWIQGVTTIAAAAGRRESALPARAAMMASSLAVRRRFGGTERAMDEFVADLDRRFANPDLADTVARVGRDPLRKLGATERIIGACRLAQAEGIDASPIARVAAAAMLYAEPSDSEAARLQARRIAEGDAAVLRAVAGLDPLEPLTSTILGAITELDG